MGEGPRALFEAMANAVAATKPTSSRPPIPTNAKTNTPLQRYPHRANAIPLRPSPPLRLDIPKPLGNNLSCIHYFLLATNYILCDPVKLTQREYAYRHIRNKVAVGTVAAGERIYPAVLAREIGMSLIPVREAIGQLQSEGLVVNKPHRGIFVKEIERRDLVDLIEFRTTLECAAAANAARRINVVQLSELGERWQDLCRAMMPFDVPRGAKLDDLSQLLQTWHLADLAFHMLLFRAAGNRRAIRAMEDTHVIIRMFGQRVYNPAAWTDPAAYTAESLRVHADVYEAVRQHDPKAARRSMAVHMRRTSKNLLAHFDWLQRHKDAAETGTDDFPDSMRESIRDIQIRDESRPSRDSGLENKNEAEE
jgi:DNA-binding GntR family transcriptional regulator